jgi:hypothetical protein
MEAHKVTCQLFGQLHLIVYLFSMRKEKIVRPKKLFNQLNNFPKLLKTEQGKNGQFETNCCFFNYIKIWK